MNNDVISSAELELVEVLSEESECLSYVTDHINRLANDLANRELSGTHVLGGQAGRQTIEERLFDDMAFEWSGTVNKKVMAYLTKNKILTGKDSTISKVIKEVPQNQKKRVTALVCLRDGGLDIVRKHKLFDLAKVTYPLTFSCGACGEPHLAELTIEQLLVGRSIEDACGNCGHTPKVNCKCNLCSSAHVAFDRAKMVESRVHCILDETNGKIKSMTDDNVPMEFDVDVLSLLSQFLAFRGGMSKDAHLVVEKAVDVFKASDKFEFNTYRFVENVLGKDGNVKKIAGELIRSGFYYKKGMTLRKRDGEYSKVRLALPDPQPRLHLMSDGSICVSNDTPDGSYDSALYFSSDEQFSLELEWDGKPFSYDEFAVSRWALEHLSYGGVYSTKDGGVNTSGSVLKDKLVRDVFIAEAKKGTHYLFPNIKIASLVSMDDALRFLNSTSAKLLENFEAPLVSFNNEFEADEVFVYQGHSDINLFSKLIEPNLISRGIKVKYI